MSPDYLPRVASQEMVEHQFPTPIPTADGLRFADAQRGGQERDFRNNEQLLCSLSDMLPVMIWITGPDGLCTYFNQFKLKFAGRSLESILGTGWTEGVHPDDLGRCWSIYAKAFGLREPFEMQFRFRRHDGEYRWLASSAVPRFNADGSFLGYIGSATDITEHKMAEQSLSKVGKWWIEGQEDERVKVAQELRHHIDSLITVSLGLDRYEQNPPESVADVRPEIAEIRKQVNEIVSGILGLSHRLHPWKLEYLGLAKAASSVCKEFADTENVKIDFRSEGVSNEVPKEIALCLYRILQEALHNATKHSRSQRVEVSLTAESNEIKLIVRDWGIGFDVAGTAQVRRLGLASMEERLSLVNGGLSIESRPQEGTTICARVPLKEHAKTTTTS